MPSPCKWKSASPALRLNYGVTTVSRQWWGVTSPSHSTHAPEVTLTCEIMEWWEHSTTDSPLIACGYRLLGYPLPLSKVRDNCCLLTWDDAMPDSATPTTYLGVTHVEHWLCRWHPMYFWFSNIRHVDWTWAFHPPIPALLQKPSFPHNLSPTLIPFAFSSETVSEPHEFLTPHTHVTVKTHSCVGLVQ